MQRTFTSALLASALIATGVNGEQIFEGKLAQEVNQWKQAWRPEGGKDESSQDPLNKMLTLVASNAMNYFRKSWLNNTEYADVEFQFNETVDSVVTAAEPIISGIRTASKSVQKNSLWAAYHPNEALPEATNKYDYNDSEEVPLEVHYEDNSLSKVDYEDDSDREDFVGDEEYIDYNPWKQSLLQKGTCSLCRFNVDLLNTWAQDELVQMVLERITDDFCYMGRFSLYLNSCKGFSRHFVPGLLDNLSEIILTPDYLCSLMNFCEQHPSYEPLDASNYIEGILADKPDYLKNDDFIDKLYESMQGQEGRPTISLIQFTDVHLDLDYKEGSSIICNNMLCCREDDGYPSDPELQAGPYGALAQCDVPASVLFKMGDKINELEPDALFWTGDITPHDMWNQSVDHVIRYSDFLTNFMTDQLSDWATYVIDGNHDFGQLINSMDFREGKRDPIIDHQAITWKQWFDDDAMAQFNKNGFYSMRFKTSDGRVHEKVRILAINTEACYYFNLFLLAEMSDPGDQLAWLEETLREMQENGEVAILMGHHPPGYNDCLSEWAKRLGALMERYQDVIRVSFFGHVHEEMYSSIRAWESDRSVGVNHWTAAITSYSEKMTPAYPSFRRFILDEETMLPVKIETYTLDILAEEPEFVLDHELTELYEMTDLSPMSFDDLTLRMSDDAKLAYVFERAKNAFGPNLNIGDECDAKCRERIYCETSFAVYSDVRACQGKKEEGSFFDDPFFKLATMTAGTWKQGEE